MQSRESEMDRAAAALTWSSLLATPHSLLTYHDRRDEHSWTKTALNKTVQFARNPHAVNMLQREGEHLGVEGSMLENVRNFTRAGLLISRFYSKVRELRQFQNRDKAA